MNKRLHALQVSVMIRAVRRGESVSRWRAGWNAITGFIKRYV